jgi:hypothetical protein
MPTERERSELDVSDGVPLIVIERDSQDHEIYPADRALIQIITG